MSRSTPKPRLDDGRILVTGASTGLGRAFAQQLGPRARKLILVARDAQRLEEVAAELRAVTPTVDVDVVPGDLNDPDFRQRLLEHAREAGVDVLINNAGMGHDGLVDRLPRERALAMVRLNVEAVVDLTLGLVPAMVERGQGGVLLIGSAAGHSVLPATSVYGASKSFVHTFAQALSVDLAGTEVAVTEAAPGPVRTEFGERAGLADGGPLGDMQKRVAISAVECATTVLAAFEEGRPFIVPGNTFRRVMRLAGLIPATAQLRRSQDQALARRQKEDRNRR